MSSILRNLREDRDLTQREMAEILNMSQTGYSKYETGENDIPTAIFLCFVVMECRMQISHH